MCTMIDLKSRDEILAALAERGYIDLWKTYIADYSRDGSIALYAKFHERSRGGVIKESGWIVSDRGETGITKEEQLCTSVNHGIHTYRYEHVRSKPPATRVIVKVRCYQKDFVCADAEAAVFTKVKLLKREWKSAMRQAGV